jgi:uncharacterized membrane protein YeaQ/YmgE (transglycosylase-associated protein family)
MRSRNF